MPVTGRVTITAPPRDTLARAGDVVQGIGWLAGPEPSTNPGEVDRRLHAWRSGWVGRIRMDASPTLIEAAGTLHRTLRAARDLVDAGLLASLDGWCNGSTRALVVAMTTGRHLNGYAELRQRFAATGLSHFLAISGFNVAVLFITLGALLELLRVPGWWRGWVMALAAVAFLLVVDVEVSVLRAGIAGLLAGLSMALGRGWRANGTLATAAIVTLLVDPASAWNAGFQLSYLAVLALRHGTSPVTRIIERGLCVRCWRPRRLRRLGSAACSALGASVAASIAATPITLAWFGTMNPWCAIASTLLGPLAAAITVLATLCAVIGLVPWIGPAVGLALAVFAGAFEWGVEAIGTWPGCSIAVGRVPWWCSVVVLLSTFAWWIARDRPLRQRALVAMATAWITLPLLAEQPTVAPAERPNDLFRWTALAVGDGSAHLIEAGGSCVLFDAGTISRRGAGSSLVVPALQALGVTRLDAVIVSHPHLDHFSALPETLAALRVDRVLLTQPWFDRAGPAAEALLARLHARGVTPQRLAEGAEFRQGPVTWRCVHPPADFKPGVVNDGSAAFVLRHERWPDRPLALLLGDAQDRAIARMLARRDILRPWVMELPHHGGWRPIAQALCEWVQPSFVMQSTGARRFRRDRFDACLRDATRGVTCRDGAVRFSLDLSNRTARLEHWSGTAWRPLPQP